MDARCIRIKKFADTKISGYVWTGPKCYKLNFWPACTVYLEISRCWSESISMKVSDIIVSFVKII